jgi:hypothetical protein
MRNALVAGAVIVLGSAAAGSAIAGEGTTPQGQVQTFDMSQKTAAKGISTGNGTLVRLRTTMRRADGSVASAFSRLRLHFPRGMKINTKRFPKCDMSRLLARGAGSCPKDSLVGDGTATADARPVLNTVSAKVRAYNGKKDTLFLYVTPTLSSPLTVDFQLDRQVKGPFGGSLTWDNRTALLLGPPAPITSVDIRIGATLREARRDSVRRKVRIPYLAGPRRCPAGGYRWRLSTTYYNYESLTVDDAVPCTH